MVKSSAKKKIRRRMKDVVVALIMLVCTINVINLPVLGAVAFIPDAIPIAGNLDEITSWTFILLGLNYFGIPVPNPRNIQGFFEKKEEEEEV